MSKNPTIRLGIIVIGLYMIVTTSQSIGQLWRAEDKVTARERTLAGLVKEREDLFRRKSQVESPDYVEKMAYDKLGFSKPGEEVIIIPQELLAGGSKVAEVGQRPNWEKWWRLLL